MKYAFKCIILVINARRATRWNMSTEDFNIRRDGEREKARNCRQSCAFVEKAINIVLGSPIFNFIASIIIAIIFSVVANFLFIVPH